MLYRVDSEEYLPSLKPELVFPDERWLAEAGTAGLCPCCKCIDRSRHPQPVEIVLANPPEGQTSARVETTGVTIWRRDFLGVISRHVDQFVLGRCLLTDGTVLDDYATCYTNKYIVVRGNRQSRYQVCADCGVVTSEVKPGPEYVLARDVTDGEVYQDAQCRIFLSEAVAWAYDFDNWGQDAAFVALKAVSIRDTPADGQHLPGDVA